TNFEHPPSLVLLFYINNTYYLACSIVGGPKIEQDRARSNFGRSASAELILGHSAVLSWAQCDS
ncbi:MAG: hypothetical protein P8Y27_18350, partial [Chromatiaceae bacterium]